MALVSIQDFVYFSYFRYWITCKFYKRPVKIASLFSTTKYLQTFIGEEFAEINKFGMSFRISHVIEYIRTIIHTTRNDRRRAIYGVVMQLWRWRGSWHLTLQDYWKTEAVSEINFIYVCLMSLDPSTLWLSKAFIL